MKNYEATKSVQITYATEGYPPNISIAQNRLQPLGIKVFEIKDDNNLPFDKDSFDLVINRHASYAPREVFRILSKGGIFITQLVGELDNVRLNHFLGDHSRDRNEWCLENAVNELVSNGFKIISSQEAFTTVKFTDIGAIVFYLRVIAWQIPGLDLQNELIRLKLRELNEQISRNGPFETKQHRFMVIGQK